MTSFRWRWTQRPFRGASHGSGGVGGRWGPGTPRRRQSCLKGSCPPMRTPVGCKVPRTHWARQESRVPPTPTPDTHTPVLASVRTPVEGIGEGSRAHAQTFSRTRRTAEVPLSVRVRSRSSNRVCDLFILVCSVNFVLVPKSKQQEYFRALRRCRDYEKETLCGVGGTATGVLRVDLSPTRTVEGSSTPKDR